MMLIERKGNVFVSFLFLLKLQSMKKFVNEWFIQMCRDETEEMRNMWIMKKTGKIFMIEWRMKGENNGDSSVKPTTMDIAKITQTVWLFC